MDGDHFIDSFPYVHAEEFQQRPELFSTNAALNTFISSPDFFLIITDMVHRRQNNPVVCA